MQIDKFIFDLIIKKFKRPFTDFNDFYVYFVYKISFLTLVMKEPYLVIPTYVYVCTFPYICKYFQNLVLLIKNSVSSNLLKLYYI